MKKLLTGSGLLLLSSLLHAQPPARQRPPAPDWRHDSTMLANELQLSEAKLRAIQPAFTDFYKKMDALVRNERPRPPRFIDVQQLVKQRDALVLRALSKEEGEDFLRFEHRLMPPPPAGPEGMQQPPMPGGAEGPQGAAHGRRPERPEQPDRSGPQAPSLRGTKQTP